MANDLPVADRANHPASWLTPELLAEQREAVAD
jgi:hypothetical protein